MHEQGHVLGLLDADANRSDLMFGTLSEGERRLPTFDQADGAEPGSVTELAFIKLNEASYTGGDVENFLISPDSSRVVYRADGDTYGFAELYSRAIDGSGSEVKLNDAFSAGGSVFTFLISPDSSRVVYTADGDTDGVNELYSRAIDGSGSQVKLNDALPTGGDVQIDFLISPDSSRVVYRADGDADGVIELYSSAIDGSSSEVKLNDALPVGGNVLTFLINPDSSGVVYRADGDTDNVFELYSRAIDGSGSEIKLNDAFPTGGTVFSFLINPDSSGVVYRADGDTDNVFELYSRAIDGSGSEIKLNDAFPTGGNVMSFRISPDSSSVVYLADGDTNNIFELYSRAIDGSGSEVKLNDTLTSGGDVQQFLISPNSSSVVYTADGDTDFVTEIYSRAIDGSGSEVKLNDAFAAGGIVITFLISPDSSRVVYVADAVTNSVEELYSRAIDGSGSEVKLNATVPEFGNTLDYLISPDSSRVVYRPHEADGDTDEVPRLYSRAIDGSDSEVEINAALPPGGAVRQFLISPSSSSVVYSAEGDTNGVTELYSRAIDGSGSEAKLNDPLAEVNHVRSDFLISPDSSWVIYPAVGDTNGVSELYSRAIDGSGSEVKLNDDVLPVNGYVLEFLISPDSSSVVYRADGETDNVFELYSRAIDGSGAEVKLNDALPTGGVVGSYLISPDSSRVVYIADGDTNNVFELYSRAIDGSDSEVKLNDALPAGGGVQSSFLISPDSSWVVFPAEGDTDGIRELYSRAIDGSGSEAKVSGALTAGGSVFGFVISPNSSRVVYIADGDTDNVLEVYSLAIDGSGSEVKLNGALQSNGDVQSDILISPDSSTVVYRADSDTDSLMELYSRAIDGSGSEAKLPSYGSTFAFLISPDSSRVVYLAVAGAHDLYSEPLNSTTFETAVSASSDDAEEKLSSGTMSLASGDLDMVFDSSGSQQGYIERIVGMRFTGVNVPRGATIQNATIQFQADETSSEAASLTIQGEDADNALTFSSAKRDISSRVTTAASVSWSPNAWTTVGDAGPDQQTPNFASVIQEIVDRPGWSSGNALSIIITGAGERVAESFDGNAAGAPLLHIEFGPAAPGVTVGDTIDVAEGTLTDSYDVVLDSVPTADVEITVTPDSQTDLGAGPGTAIVLSFTPSTAQTPQTVNVTAVDDAVVEGPHTSTITHTATSADSNYDGIAINSVTANITENDSAPLYLSLKNGVTLPGALTVENEDIVAFDGTDFSLFFDGSDVGIRGTNVDALAVIAADEILLSFASAEIIPGITGTVEDSDIVKFTATGLGDTTSGTFELFFRGSDVGFSPTSEDIDAVDLHGDGRLIISTIGNFDVTGVNGRDEDLIAFTPDTPGDYSSGTWAMYFDGSDVGLGGEDVYAAALDSNGDILLSTTNALNVTNVSGDDEDIFTFTPSQLGANTAGTYASALLFDGSQFGLTANDVNAIGLPIPATGSGADALRLVARAAESTESFIADETDTERHDVSGDGEVTSLDALLVINSLSTSNTGSLDEDQIDEMDVNQDGSLSATRCPARDQLHEPCLCSAGRRYSSCSTRSS